MRTNPATGSFNLIQPATKQEKLTLIIESEGYYPVERSFSLAAKEQLEFNISMSEIPRGKIKGLVDLADKEIAMEKVQVTLNSTKYVGKSYLSSDGSFNFHNVPEGLYYLQVTAPGHRGTSLIVSVTAGKTSAFDIKLSMIKQEYDRIIAYDNGKRFGSFVNSSAGNGRAVKITPEGTIQLRGINVYVEDWTGGDNFSVLVYDSSPTGSLGDKVIEPISVSAEPSKGWNYVDLTAFNFVTRDEFFIVVMQNCRQPFSSAIACTEEPSNRSFNYHWDYANGGYLSVFEYSLMIRAAVDYIDEPESVRRISGSDRYSTAVAISKEGWDTSSKVVLARGNDYADALAGVPLAYQLDAPILLTRSDLIVPDTMAEITRLGAQSVIILGGYGAISEKAEKELQARGLETLRLAGSTRYQTAAYIAEYLSSQVDIDKAVLARGDNFPDALAAASYAATNGYPILLVGSTFLPGATAQAIDDLGIQDFIAVGGTGVISQELLQQLPSATRIAGANRYETAVELIKYFTPPLSLLYFATGTNYADAVTGGVLAAKNNSGMLLVRPNQIPQAVKDYISETANHQIMLFGGINAINDNVIYEAMQLIHTE